MEHGKKSKMCMSGHIGDIFDIHYFKRVFELMRFDVMLYRHQS